jgi:hypothetical protein
LVPDAVQEISSAEATLVNCVSRALIGSGLVAVPKVSQATGQPQ